MSKPCGQSKYTNVLWYPKRLLSERKVVRQSSPTEESHSIPDGASYISKFDHDRLNHEQLATGLTITSSNSRANAPRRI
jgi:hypothetical protein